MELYKKYRPKKLSDVVGQSQAINVLQKLLDTNSLPQTLLFSGPSGCGKTTICRILKKLLNCNSHDFMEINAAISRGIDTIRDIEDKIRLPALYGENKIYLVDECHRLTSDAQEGLLKILEDTPKNVYFMLATTNPASLKKTIITRATEIRVKLLTDSEIKTVINKAADAEKVVLPKDVLDKLVDVSEGSARKCLVILHQIIQLKTEDEQLQAIQKSESKDNAILLIRALLDTRTQWITIGNYLKSIEDEPETVRRIMLSYCSKILMGNSPMVSRAFLAIKSFQDHYYDSGKAGLCASCYSFWTLSKGKR